MSLAGQVEAMVEMVDKTLQKTAMQEALGLEPIRQVEQLGVLLVKVLRQMVGHQGQEEPQPLLEQWSQLSDPEEPLLSC